MVLHVVEQLMLDEARFNDYYSFFLVWADLKFYEHVVFVWFFNFPLDFCKELVEIGQMILIQLEILIFTDGQTYRQISKLHQEIRKVF